MASAQKGGTLLQVRQAHLILVTGLPGTGKSTLARRLSRHFSVPLIYKDAIKEPLFDVLGAPNREGPRQLSNASFAVMFSILRDCRPPAPTLFSRGTSDPASMKAQYWKPDARHPYRSITRAKRDRPRLLPHGTRSYT